MKFKRKHVWRVCVLSSFVFLAGCSTLRISSDYDPAANFSVLKTYAWETTQPAKDADPRIANTLVDTRIRTAVDKILSEHGYVKRAENAGPDFLVGYHAAIYPKVEATSVPGPGPSYYRDYYRDSWYGTGWYDPFWTSGGVMVNTYDEGRLIVDVIDARSKKLMWQGMAADAVDSTATPEARQRKTENAVRRLFERFPPNASPQRKRD